MNVHPKLAVGISTFLYGILVIILGKIFEIDFSKRIITYVVLLVQGVLVYKYFLDRYDGIE